MKTCSAVRLVLALALAAAFFSCTAQGGSIYATIETEQKINVSTLDQTITILDIVNVAAAPLPYFVAAGAVYNGTLPDANNEIGWPRAGHDPVAVRPPASGALCEALTYFPFTSRLYGGFFSDGPGMGLYTSGTTSPSFSTAVAFAGQQVTLLRTDPSDPAHILFAVIATPANSGTSGFTYGLWYSSDGTTFLQATTGAAALTGLPRITGVAFLAGKYYVTSGSTLYAGGTPTTLSPVDPLVVGNKSELLQDVSTDSNTNCVLLPSDNGRVYFSTDNGTTWAFGNTNDTLNSRSISFLTVSTHADTGAVPGAGHVYLVGTDGAGFYYLDTATPPRLDRYSDVTVTGLYAGSVRKILIDNIGQTDMVFMGTAGTGLWRAYFNPSDGTVFSNWVHE